MPAQKGERPDVRTLIEPITPKSIELVLSVSEPVPKGGHCNGAATIAKRDWFVGPLLSTAKHDANKPNDSAP